MKYYHYTEKYLISPTHPVTINLIGCGGTGSRMLNNLGKIHTALRALGHPGFHVAAWDGDIVTDANLGRQMFAEGDVSLHKSLVLISRANRFYGTAWQAITKNFEKPSWNDHRNITISCVDTVSARRKIYNSLKGKVHHHEELYNPYYWMDIGNNKNRGQAILGTVGDIVQPKKTPGSIKKLRNVFDLFPNMEKHEGPDSGPSCSLAEALEQQDLFINSTLSEYAGDIIWKMFRELRIENHGQFVNMEASTSNPLKVR